MFVCWAAIILPEQSVASDRAGLAVNKKGLTLRELLQQTSHHNAKIRKGTYFPNLGQLHAITYIGIVIISYKCYNFVCITEAALTGIKDLVVKHPSELKLHKLVVIEKLRERICDADKVVRETLYQLLENDIFPCIKEVFQECSFIFLSITFACLNC